MGRLRVIVEPTYTDHDATAAFLEKATTYIEENYPETLAWESYLDRDIRRVTMFEEFTDEGALAEYQQGMARTGLNDEAMT